MTRGSRRRCGAHRRPGHRRLAGATGMALVCTLLVLLTVAVLRPGDTSGGQIGAAGPTAPSSAASAPSAPKTATPTASPASASAAALAARERTARRAIAAIVAGVPGGAAGVSATDLTTGVTVTAGSTAPEWTASVYKLLVLVTLLREGGPLTGAELEQATAMIEQSDNTAGYDLWEDAGGNAALSTTLTDLGMTHSRADGTDPAFTRLTPADTVKLLGVLVRRNDVVSRAGQAQALGLMRNVEADQRWGVGAIADAGTDFANKNGWLAIDDDNGPGEDDDDLWAVASAGIVTVDGHEVLMAAMSEHGESMQAGVNVVQSLARQAAILLGDAQSPAR